VDRDGKFPIPAIIALVVVLGLKLSSDQAEVQQASHEGSAWDLLDLLMMMVPGSGSVAREIAAASSEAKACKAAAGASSPIVEGGGLAAHEAAGGHVIARHVGLEAAALDARQLPVASTFLSRAEAEAAAAAALSQNSGQVAAWLQAGAVGNLKLTTPFSGGHRRIHWGSDHDDIHTQDQRFGWILHTHRVSSAMSTKHSRLEQFFGGYFHQDWDVEGAASWKEVIAQYFSDVPRAQVATLRGDLREWLTETEKDVSQNLPPSFGCDYEPRLDGLTDRQWVVHIVAELDRLLQA